MYKLKEKESSKYARIVNVEKIPLKSPTMEIPMPQLRLAPSKTIPASPFSFPSSSSKPPQPISLHQNIACANPPATPETGSSSVHVLDATETDLPNGNNTILDVDSFESFPPGYRFCPLDEELVVHYLKNKVHSLPLPRNKIVELNLYSYNPEELAGSFILTISPLFLYYYYEN